MYVLLIVVWIVSIIFVYYGLFAKKAFKLENDAVWKGLHPVQRFIMLLSILLIAPLVALAFLALMYYQNKLSALKEG